MPSSKEITSEGFQALLKWLDGSSDIAAAKYEKIRHRLIRLFAGRGCYEAESMADLTIDRVAGRASELIGRYEGDPALYFYGVAKKVHHEWLRQQKRPGEAGSLNIDSGNDGDAEARIECLESCLSRLRPGDRDMIVNYYEDEKSERIRRRKQLAAGLGISIGALHIKASRIRVELAECTSDCIGRNCS